VVENGLDRCASLTLLEIDDDREKSPVASLISDRAARGVIEAILLCGIEGMVLVNAILCRHQGALRE
jgi:hypothetical protein